MPNYWPPQRYLGVLSRERQWDICWYQKGGLVRHFRRLHLWSLNFKTRLDSNNLFTVYPYRSPSYKAADVRIVGKFNNRLGPTCSSDPTTSQDGSRLPAASVPTGAGGGFSLLLMPTDSVPRKYASVFKVRRIVGEQTIDSNWELNTWNNAANFCANETSRQGFLPYTR